MTIAFEHSCVLPQWSTPLRKDTGVFESYGRFIGLKCHNYALYLCFIYIYMYLIIIPRIGYEITTQSS